jgi:hypothetical protein
MLRAVPGRTPAARAGAWVRRLGAAGGDLLPAASLYAGDHWSVVRSMQEDTAGSGRRVNVWVCSAGYGLIPLEAKVAAYAATFAPNHPDSVTRGERNGKASAARRAWWSALAAWPGPAPGSPRRIADLVSGRKDCLLLVAASPHYLDAVTDDLEQAAEMLGPTRLSIFSAGADSHPSLDRYCIPCDGRLQNVLGGSLISLNCRCLRYALGQLSESATDLSDLPRKFARLLQKQPQLKRPQRTPLSDEAVCAFIEEALSADRGVRPTPLLRRLRESGQACEHARFGAMFRRVEGGRHG